MRTLMDAVKQKEKEHCETQKLLEQERSARALREDQLNQVLRQQRELEEQNIHKNNQALSQLSEAKEREKELLQQTSTLQKKITNLEDSQKNSCNKLLEENQALRKQLEEAHTEIQAKNDLLTQTVLNCNSQLTTLKSEMDLITSSLENERQTREGLQKEVEQTHAHLNGVIQDFALREDRENI
ncbi:hypothetical protein WMY93_021745 [Mugilogobius chulae]|uniref:CCDC144C-like coiled-coil domain-containing protein n=1 Tax=Mugilogobius chulae TaxID=88201 RepID=A0AAW0NCS8_9GOBI